MPYQIGFDQDTGASWFMCLRPGCEALGRKSYSLGDINNCYCSGCGYHESTRMHVRQITPEVKVIRVDRAHPLKMYILVRDAIDLGHSLLAVAHGVLAAHKTFTGQPLYDEWVSGSFRKVVCRVSDAEFATAKHFPDRVVMTESGLDGEETCMVFCPRETWPKPFRFYQLYRSLDSRD